MENQNQISESQYNELLETLKQSNKMLAKDLTFKQNFIKGIYSGLGATLGIAMLFAIAGVVIRSLGGLPVIGSFLLKWGSYLHK